MKEARQFGALSRAELETKLVELRQELIKLNAQVAMMAPIKNSAQLRRTKRAIARISTFLRAKGEGKDLHA